MFRGKQAMQRQFLDTLQVGTLSGDMWGATPDTPTWTYDIVNVLHGFVKHVVSRVVDGEVADGSEAPIVNATIYLPFGTSVTSGQRLKLTHRDRTALGAVEIYAIIGNPQQARTCLALNAKQITGESSK